MLWMYTVTGQHKDHSSLCTLTKFGAFTQYDSAFFDGRFLPLDGLSEKKKPKNIRCLLYVVPV